MNDRQSKEKVYDTLISPLILKVHEICTEHNIPFYSTFEYDASCFCQTSQANNSKMIEHLSAIGQCADNGGVNIDKYMFWVAKNAHKHGHSSVVLSLMNIPISPKGGEKWDLRHLKYVRRMSKGLAKASMPFTQKTHTTTRPNALKHGQLATTQA